MSLSRILVLLTISVAPVLAQVSGVVRDSSGRPIPDVRFSLSDKTLGFSDSAGRFLLRDVRSGQWVAFRKVGFLSDSVRTPANAQSEAILVLRRVPTLNPVNVTAHSLVPAKYQFTTRYDEFFRRRQAHIGGNFFDADDLKKMGGVVNAIRTVPSVRAGEFNGRLSVSTRRCGRGEKMGLVVNGILRDLSALNEIDVSLIELVEVYRGVADLPPEVRGNSCGAIVIYTK